MMYIELQRVYKLDRATEIYEHLYSLGLRPEVFWGPSDTVTFGILPWSLVRLPGAYMVKVIKELLTYYKLRFRISGSSEDPWVGGEFMIQDFLYPGFYGDSTCLVMPYPVHHPEPGYSGPAVTVSGRRDLVEIKTGRTKTFEDVRARLLVMGFPEDLEIREKQEDR